MNSVIVMVSLAQESFAGVMPSGKCAPLAISEGDASDAFGHHMTYEQYRAYVTGERGCNAPYGLDGDDAV